MSSSQTRKTGSTAVDSTPVPGDLSENLRRLDRLANLGLFSAGVAHEIKNGLVAIKTHVELLLEKGQDIEMAEMVRRELNRIDGLATQMLRLSSPKPAANSTVAIHTALDHSLKLLEHQLKSRMIALNRDYAALPDAVCGNESELQQAFMNLALNGIEAIGNGGELTVRTALATAADGGRRVQVSFHDSGPGIAPENLARLFEPFFTTKKHGTGLGLAICRRVAEDHHGHLEATNAPGRGAVFILSLPAE